jgi:hypothetical protein
MTPPSTALAIIAVLEIAGASAVLEEFMVEFCV